MFYAKNFTNGPKVLIPGKMVSYVYLNIYGNDKIQTFVLFDIFCLGDFDRQTDMRFVDNPQCLELLVVGLGYKKRRPYILVSHSIEI